MLSFAAGLASGVGLTPEPVEDNAPESAYEILSASRSALEAFAERTPLTQLEMAQASSDIWKISEMELAWLDTEIVSHPNFSTIADTYLSNCNVWENRFKTAMTLPSNYAGGSFEGTDLNYRGIGHMRERIEVLQRQLVDLDR